MKSILSALLVICCISMASPAQAQPAQRQNLFDQQPEQISLNIQTLEQVMNAREGQETTVHFSPGFIFTGIVISNEQKYHNLQTVLIKSPMFDQALFSLSRINTEDGLVQYSGRILHAQAGDGFLLKKSNQQDYRLTKINTVSVLEDCSFQ